MCLDFFPNIIFSRLTKRTSKSDLTVGLVSLVILMGILAVPSRACLPIGRFGAAVDVAEETAIILWDAETRTEHFIRRARFISDAKDIGFLVPTPTRPELVEVDNFVFDELWRYTNPPPPTPPSRAEGNFAAPAPRSMPDAVRVLETKTVAGLDATILAADDAGALTDWLKKNEYPTNPETQAWLEPYLKDKWIITAYKINNDKGAGSFGLPKFQTSTVRMTFKADNPFYPYREPRGAGKNVSDRLLRVYFLAQEAHEANLLETRWETSVPYAKRISRAFQEQVASLLKLPKPANGEPWFLTEFEDRATVRKPGAEVVFLPNPQMAIRERPQPSSFGFPGNSKGSWSQSDRDLIRVLFPVGLAFLALVGFSGWAILRRKKTARMD